LVSSKNSNFVYVESGYRWDSTGSDQIVEQIDSRHRSKRSHLSIDQKFELLEERKLRPWKEMQRIKLEILDLIQGVAMLEWGAKLMMLLKA